MAKKTPRRGNPNWKPGVSGNPSGRAKSTAIARRTDGATIIPATPQEIRADGWQSMITGIGDSRYHKGADAVFAPPRLVTYLEAQNLWRGNDIAARIIEIRPKEMLRAGFELCIADDDTKVEDVEPKTAALAPGEKGAAPKAGALGKAPAKGGKPNPKKLPDMARS